MDLAHVDALNIGVIDDFDDKVTPRLAKILADNLTDCRLKILTAPSNELTRLLAQRELHIAISAATDTHLDGVIEHPIAQDRFMIVAPRTAPFDLKLFNTGPELPFLRYQKEQLISQQIGAELTKHSINLPERFEIGSHLALMSMIANGVGWAITTPLGYMRGERFRDGVQAYA